MNKPALSTKNMAVGYDGKILIQDIELSVCSGEILTLIGPNGAGKSTVLASITKKLKLIAGTVYIDGKSFCNMSEKQMAKKVSVMLTGKPEPELMTCREVVESGRFPYTGRFGVLSEKDKQIVMDSMRTVDVQELAERDFSCISDGQRQRVMLARAVCQQPEILVLDEPTSFLDIRHKLELLSMLKKLVREKNIAVIMSLHELDLAQRISDKIVCINSDKIDKVGTPEEIFTSEYINKLYHVEKGCFDGTYGTIELEKAEGEAKIFVISGNGTGIPVFHKLQRKGIPFFAGILHENDIDIPAAKLLANEIITEKAFEEITEKTFNIALEKMLKCSAVICTLDSFGTINGKNKNLMRIAKQNNMLIDCENFESGLKDRKIL